MSAFLKLENVSVRFRVYGVGSQSIKKQLISYGTGGRLARDASNHFAVQALDNISLELKDGDRLGIIGANGSGKSTLLRTMAGIYRPSNGTISSQGRIAAIIDSGIGLEPQATGLENITSRAVLMGVPKNHHREYAARVRDICELGDYLSMPVHTYSSGMMMRLNFALAISVNPDILILDEWLSVADSSFQNKAEALMGDLVSRSRILVVASHDLDLINRTCNRSILLDKGCVATIRDLQ